MVTTIDLDRVRRAVEAVPDPEMPAVTLGMLGVVHDVTVIGGDVHVELLPTFAGCPATDAMADDVVAAVTTIDGVGDVAVRFTYDPPWTPARISDEGRRELASFGIAPPPRRGPALPLVGTEPARACPFCGSTDTQRDGLFGPTPCRDVRYCRACQQPFEAVKA